MNNANHTILVTGATGNVGGELVNQLSRLNRPVRALVRKQKPNLFPDNVQIVVGDLNRPESLREALKGVHFVFLLGGHNDMPGILSEIHRANVEHVVLLSSRSVIDGKPDNAIVSMWMTSENVVKSSGVPWTILRPSGFMSNVLRWLPQLRAGDIVRVPFADAPIAAIDPYDIAAVALTVLTTQGHEERHYALTGPEALLPADQVRILGAALGRNLHFEKQPDAEAKAELGGLFPKEFVEAFFRFFVEGEFNDSSVLPTVQEITGSQPRTFGQWAEVHFEAFQAP